MSSKLLPDKNIAVPKNAIPNLPIVPDTTAAAFINKLQVSCEDGLPVQQVSGENYNDNNGSRINQNPPIPKNICPKISKLMCPLPTDCIEQMFTEEGPLKYTTGWTYGS